MYVEDKIYLIIIMSTLFLNQLNARTVSTWALKHHTQFEYELLWLYEVNQTQNENSSESSSIYVQSY